MKKKLFYALSLALFLSASVYSAPFDAFNYVLNGIAADPYAAPKQKEKAAQKVLDTFTKDVGQAIAGGAYGAGGGLGIGEMDLTLSIKMSYQQVSNDDKIVKVSGDDAIYFPIVQAELGFLEKFDAIARFSYFNNAALLGGGLRYEILTSEDEAYIPTVSVQSVYNYLIDDDSDYGKFNAWNLKTGTTALFNMIPYVQPFVFVSYDITALKPVTSYYSYLSSEAYGFGYGAGLNLSVETINLNFSISMYDNQPNYNFGIFIGI